MLSKYEQETIINFNKEERVGYIFTYEKTWQEHLEKRLGLKPIMSNGQGGKEYQIDKGRIKMPRAPLVLSAKRRKQLSDGLIKRHLGRKSMKPMAKTGHEIEG